MRYFSMFSGIGGFELGIQRAYAEWNELVKDHPQYQKSAECVGFSEIDKYAVQIYSKHFPGHKNYGDATKIDTAELPDFDLLVGGFPCQAFSVAGKRRGFDDARGTLFFEIARILRDKRPRCFLLENVKGLLSHDSGKTAQTILKILADLSYDVQWQVLNSKFHGVPQNRERIFLVGCLRGERGFQVFPIGDRDTDHRGCDGVPRSLIELTKNVSQGYRVYDPNGIATTLASQAGGLGAKTGLYAIAPNQKKVDLTNAPDVPFQVKEVRTEQGKATRKEIRQLEGRDSTARGKDDKMYIPKTDDVANCLTTGKENVEKWVCKGRSIRRLTPVECERLQGFPDHHTAGISDTQRYKCLGNAVTVNVVRDVVKRLLVNL